MNDAEFVLVKKRLRGLIGLDLDCYKSPQMQRRLDGYLDRVRVASWPELLHRLEHDPVALNQLRDFITINVSSFFRDARKWEELRNYLLPQIAKRTQPFRAWSAACSHGAEAFTLAMLCEEHAAISRYQILGTDVDRTVLEHARAGGPYTAEDVRELPDHLLTRFLQHDNRGYWVLPTLRRQVSFLEHDLLRSTANSEFDLVVCRNVLIYFTEAAKSQVIRSLVQALRPGGVLFIGATESIPLGVSVGVERIGFSSFYRRVVQ
jgi:chemotaxis protein methyltransferase CheR